MNPIYRFALTNFTTELLDRGASDVELEKRIDETTGQTVTAYDHNTSGYMDVSGYAMLVVNESNWDIAFYDSEKVFISVGSNDGNTIFIPATAKYFRISVIDTRWNNLSVIGQTMVYPIYSSDLSKDYELQTGEQFFRAKLSGKLKFSNDDYAKIKNAVFDTEFELAIIISYDAGQTWESYWRGSFWKTDCEFDGESGTVSVTPIVKDQYTDVLAGMDKEYNLIDLTPEITTIRAEKRPLIQLYVPGDSVITCLLAGMVWEQEVEPESDENVLSQTGDYKPNFVLAATRNIALITQTGTPVLPDVMTSENFDAENPFTKDGYTIGYTVYQSMYLYFVKRNSDNTTLWYANRTVLLDEITMDAAGGEATGTVTVRFSVIKVYSRMLLNSLRYDGNNTYRIGTEDIGGSNRNYTSLYPYRSTDSIAFSERLTETPTKYGLYEPNVYYEKPYSLWNNPFWPVSKSQWGRVSIWYTFSNADYTAEEKGRVTIFMEYCYPIFSVISVLLAQFAQGITHLGTTDYSAFLYGVNPLDNTNNRLFITPKSNLINSGFDEPAQKATITLRDVLNMLRDCYRCYWFIDGQGRFRIEHISWFMRGGSYLNNPTVGIDLTTQIVTRNGKPWAFGRDQYKFDKPEMAARYQFNWMDRVTTPFDGFPIDILSKYVNPDNIEQINVSKFTSDFDYILLNPDAISKDGFGLLAAQNIYDEYRLPFRTFTIDNGYYLLQNAYASFMWLQNYYAYDMPAPSYEINGEQKTATGTKRLKKQTLKFPALVDPDLYKLVKTNIGDGQIENFSINLSSRNATATLKYDTE